MELTDSEGEEMTVEERLERAVEAAMREDVLRRGLGERSKVVRRS